MPFDKGFEAYCDGEKIAIDRVDKSFMGFKLSKGSRTIKFEYHAPMKEHGVIVSLIGVTILMVLIIIEIIQKRRTKNA